MPVSHAGGEQFIEELAGEFSMSREKAIEMLSVCEEYLANRMTRAPGALEGLRVIRRLWRHIVCARTTRQQAFLIRLGGKVLGLSKEMDGDKTLTQIASSFGLTKADASKFSCLFRDSLTTGLDPLPLMPGQRDEKARAKFAKKRVEQEKARRIKK